MTRERWAVVLLVALVFGWIVVTLSTSSKAQAPGMEGRYDVTAVAVGDARTVTVVVLDRQTGRVDVHRHSEGSPDTYWFNTR